jgi:hypothetical protein
LRIIFRKHAIKRSCRKETAIITADKISACKEIEFTISKEKYEYVKAAIDKSANLVYMQSTLPDIQLKYADRVFRLYVKSLYDKAFCRGEDDAYNFFSQVFTWLPSLLFISKLGSITSNFTNHLSGTDALYSASFGQC